MRGHPPGAIWPAEDFEDVQTREVYSRYGLAMFMVQVLEHTMVNAAMVLRLLPTMGTHPDRASWEAAFDDFYEAGLGRTYGNMLKQLNALAEFPRPLLDRLRAAKEDRDILAHRFFRQNDMAFLSPDGRTTMIAWCEERVELFQELADVTEAFLEPIRSQHGITAELIDRMFERDLAAARSWTPETPIRP